ncbi:zinc finger CCCH domain-containing protein 53-like [Dorcoceras hygrometricum]|uniref:Zinc finger CCCH domain-containing protein 53-like n=1 Tax=Dorcoceras hygrometricum TaxID=472368 RepID=A0A2Z7CK17_9LAMI|nr:zinc finger CCCH domain-containing protein 53-like [Dorcoceras hygrometricum]
MEPYEATKIVFQRIQTLDPENASKIMGVLLIQDHGEKEMIRLAFGPESLLHSVILKARKELGLVSSNSPATPLSPSAFSNPLSTLSRQNSCSSASARVLGGLNLPSPLSISSSFSDFQSSDDIISPGGYINGSSPSTINSASAPFYASGEVDLIDELQLQDQLSFLNDGSDPVGFPSYAGSWAGAAAVHRRSSSVNDICMGSDDLGGGGYWWKPCLYYARGYCKNGTSCPFLHGGDGGGSMAGESGTVAVGSPSKFEMMEQCQDLLRSKSTQQQRPAAYAPQPTSKCMNFLLQQQFPADSPRALMMVEGLFKSSRNRLERGDLGIVNPGSRQIYLTFPADSTFKEEDVSSYFSIFGPVQDVRIPYQQKRMFGFVTFDYPETVKLILAKGNPHFVCDARVLVKPYKEKGKLPDKHRRQQMERGEFNACGSPTGLESRDHFDLHLGARMLYNTQDILWRRKLEEQADLQQAIELQNRRLMSLQLLDVKRNSHNRTLSTGAIFSPSAQSPTFNNHSMVFSDRSSPEAKLEGNILNGTIPNPVNVTAKDAINPPENTVQNKDSFFKSEGDNGKQSSSNECDLQESSDHNLPDSPFAAAMAAGDCATVFSNGVVETADENGFVNPAPALKNDNSMAGPTLFSSTSLDMTPYKSCYFQVPKRGKSSFRKTKLPEKCALIAAIVPKIQRLTITKCSTALRNDSEQKYVSNLLCTRREIQQQGKLESAASLEEVHRLKRVVPFRRGALLVEVMQPFRNRCTVSESQPRPAAPSRAEPAGRARVCVSGQCLYLV